MIRGHLLVTAGELPLHDLRRRQEQTCCVLGMQHWPHALSSFSTCFTACRSWAVWKQDLFYSLPPLVVCSGTVSNFAHLTHPVHWGQEMAGTSVAWPGSTPVPRLGIPGSTSPTWRWERKHTGSFTTQEGQQVFELCWWSTSVNITGCKGHHDCHGEHLGSQHATSRGKDCLHPADLMVPMCPWCNWRRSKKTKKHGNRATNMPQRDTSG